MIYHIAICDDEPKELEYLSSLVNGWAACRANTAAISTFQSAEAFLFDYGERKDYDILLLDIEMKAISGVELAKAVRRENETVQIIFVTGYSDYISEGYDVAALHYMMKPVCEEKLYNVLDRAARNISKNERMLTLELPGETVLVPFYEIKYLEVRQNYVTFHAGKEYTVKKTLSEFEALLDDRFYRMGRSYIVNLRCIKRITKKEVFLTGETVLLLPRGQYEPLNRAVISRM